MKKTTIALAVIAGMTLVGAVGAVSAVSAFAQTDGQDPTATPQPWAASGLGNMWGSAADGEGPLHDYLIAAFAEAIGIAPSELETRLADGETLSAIAQDQGLTLDEFRALFIEARQTAIENAQADGVVIQAQTQSMLRLMNGAGPNGNCLMLSDDGDVNSRIGGMGMFGNRGGGGRLQRP